MSVNAAVQAPHRNEWRHDRLLEMRERFGARAKWPRERSGNTPLQNTHSNIFVKKRTPSVNHVWEWELWGKPLVCQSERQATGLPPQDLPIAFSGCFPRSSPPRVENFFRGPETRFHIHLRKQPTEQNRRGQRQHREAARGS